LERAGGRAAIAVDGVAVVALLVVGAVAVAAGGWLAGARGPGGGEAQGGAAVEGEHAAADVQEQARAPDRAEYQCVPSALRFRVVADGARAADEEQASELEAALYPQVPVDDHDARSARIAIPLDRHPGGIAEAGEPRKHRGPERRAA